MVLMMFHYVQRWNAVTCRVADISRISLVDICLWFTLRCELWANDIIVLSLILLGLVLCPCQHQRWSSRLHVVRHWVTVRFQSSPLGLEVWNALPDYVTSAPTFASFRASMKTYTYLFSWTFWHWQHASRWLCNVVLKRCALTPRYSRIMMIMMMMRRSMSITCSKMIIVTCADFVCDKINILFFPA